jgi:prepilin-type N-terminal cleavage/methylation domain-containing protein
MKNTKQSGFTLVELAIVLVIIGLIVGGVLVGQDLIKAAEIRSAVTQIEKYNTAATAFRTKYDGFPGDLVSARATNFGFQARAGSDGLGDGDGILENGATGADKQGLGGESLLFWRDLTFAQFISEGFSTAPGTVAAALANDAAVAAMLPTLKLRDSADIHSTGIGGRNYFYIAAITAAAVTTGLPTETSALSPIEAENVDSKVDDGGTNTGIIRAYDDLADATAEIAATAAAPAAGVCVSNAAGNPYNLTVGADSVSCTIRWRASF